MVRLVEKDITGFLEKSACDKAFSDFFISFSPSSFVVGGLSCLFHCELKKISVRIDVFPIFKTGVTEFKRGDLFRPLFERFGNIAYFRDDSP